MLLILVLAAMIIGLFLWVAKLGFKRRLSKGLGRKVSDRELTSITSWMEATPDEKK
jgi:hypothetical protein